MKDEFISFPSDEDRIHSFPDLNDCSSLWRFHGKIEDKDDQEKLLACGIFKLKEHEYETLSFSMFSPDDDKFGYHHDDEAVNFLNFVVRDIYKETKSEKISRTIKKREAIELVVARLQAYRTLPDSDLQEKLESITISPEKEQNYHPRASHWDAKYATIEMQNDRNLQLVLLTCCRIH